MSEGSGGSLLCAERKKSRVEPETGLNCKEWGSEGRAETAPRKAGEDPSAYNRKRKEREEREQESAAKERNGENDRSFEKRSTRGKRIGPRPTRVDEGR